MIPLPDIQLIRRNGFSMIRMPWLTAVSMAVLLIAMPVFALQTPDDLQSEKTWSPPTIENLESAVINWLSNEPDDKVDVTISQLRERWENWKQYEYLDLVVETIAAHRIDVKKLSEAAKEKRTGLRQTDFPVILNNENEPSFVKNHLRLLYGRWLAQNDFYDEANQQFEQLTTADVLDPATLLFYHGLVQHQLLIKEKCIESMNRLLERPEQLPKRFEMVGKIMLADISPLKTDSLDEISRLMTDIRRRQSLFRAGIKVREQEQDVIKKLDKLIEDLEQQKKQQQQQSGNASPSQPMQDSQAAGGQGTGDVDGKKQIEGGDWGNLPPAKRAAALAEMAKDLPPHYRAVIEEYFRKLARDDDNQ